ncbi:hypothetical protein ASE14_00535 [Agromyces sp. Root81]|uniref:hypothetical protein n=1 Tax=Agromyces sp. Root81 TaxID=1736601 RepID=UPI0006F4DE0B|nr:hypothetical protein [Agromyces sp. Root81]KRC62370.1 hypothetical protein ASE14_00535 [Agromyces sp. Root81]
MIEITERAEVERLLADPASRVPEADRAGSPQSSFARFRAGVSRFANGATYDARRARLEELLEHLDAHALASGARERTAAAMAAGLSATDERDAERRALAAQCARHVPVAVLAAALGFARPDALPPLVATVAAAYPTGETAHPHATDAAVTQLLEAAGAADGADRTLRVQLLVQAHAATATLVERALELAETRAEATPTRTLLDAVLRDDSPVPVTRRLIAAPHGGHDLAVLRLDGPDQEAAADRPARILAFGAGPRACPAPHHALVIAAAIVDTIRADANRHEETTRHADAP